MPNVDKQMLYKCNRVFVTVSHDFYQCLMKMWMKTNHFLYEVDLGPGHMGTSSACRTSNLMLKWSPVVWTILMICREIEKDCDKIRALTNYCALIWLSF